MLDTQLPAGQTQTAERTRGVVKLFDPARGFGFVLLADGRDAFVHASVLRRDGFLSAGQGDRLECSVAPGARGLQVEAVHASEGATGSGEAPVQVVGRVKFYDMTKGYGFVRDEATGTEVFVGAKLLKKLGVTPPLRTDQLVRVTAARGDRGLVAETLTFLP